MHLTVDQTGVRSSPSGTETKGENQSPLNYVIGEINAYIAIRDELLAEAEELKIASKLDGLTIANDFVETCLTPARAPYQAQYLPEGDAVRERRRCHEIKRRIEDLREEIVSR